MSLQKQAILYGGLSMLALLGLLILIGLRALEESSTSTFQERVIAAQPKLKG